MSRSRRTDQHGGEAWLGDRKLAHEFDRLYGECGEFLDVLSQPESWTVKIRRLRLRADRLGRRLQRLSRANLRQVKSTQPVDPHVPTRVKEQAYAGLLRRAMWPCMESVQKTVNVPAQERLRLLRRRLWLSGRRLELLSQANVLSLGEQARSVSYPRQRPELAAIWEQEEGSDATSTSEGCAENSGHGCSIVCYEVSGIKVWRMALRLPPVDKE